MCSYGLNSQTEINDLQLSHSEHWGTSRPCARSTTVCSANKRQFANDATIARLIHKIYKPIYSEDVKQLNNNMVV